MKQMSFRMILLPLSFLLLGAMAGGCENFRKVFSASPSLEREKAPRKTPAKKKASLDEDPLFDRIFRHSDDRSPEISGTLSDREKEIVNAHFRENSSRDPVIQKLRMDTENSRKKNKDWVFGTKDGTYFP